LDFHTVAFPGTANGSATLSGRALLQSTNVRSTNVHQVQYRDVAELSRIVAQRSGQLLFTNAFMNGDPGPLPGS
jgi:hypothetical protein